MKNKVQLIFTGDKALDKKFAEMPLQLQKKALAKATREVAKFTMQIAREYAPHKTGALEGSLTVRAFQGKRRAKYRNTVGASVQTKMGLFQGDQFYGGFLEFGTAERFHKSGKSTGFIPQMKYWFLRPALFAFTERKLSMFTHWVRNWMLTEAVRAK